ncbi:Polysaccharide deacetylase [Pseudobythopirellula maris]|uniref:Polysaccharide deacetylase n=1 Tax=Pseudobythopirellula maris TaxID=2527991 RepID=A0A5C5ZR89_9BACT|nr:polysaccharide deacetylase family protein [Pseudobythopirellula maris]TWT89746.1 Polysaccharide deacetylase [Pseudobythopirellula maris]
MSDYALLYHALWQGDAPPEGMPAEEYNLTVEADAFSRQLAELERLGIDVVDIEELLEGPAEGRRRCAITFDDGHRSDYELALPALRDRGHTAIFYVITDKTDRDGRFLSSEQIREMRRAGMRIGSHTDTHPWLPLLDRQGVRRELRESKKKLEDLLQEEVADFCLPGGHYNKMVLEEAAAAGYRSVASCRVGVVDADRFLLPRLEVRRRLDAKQFAATFDDACLRRLARREACKATLRRTLGLRFYTRLRSIVSGLITIDR